MDNIIKIAGCRICELSPEDLSKIILDKISNKKRIVLFYANSNFIVSCRHLLDRLNHDPNIMIVNDGLAVDIASFIHQGRFFRFNMNGTDFIPCLLNKSAAKLKIYVFGSSENTIKKAAEFSARKFNITIVGFSDGYSFRNNHPYNLVKDINNSNPDILLVGMGNPLQEEWILDNAHMLNVPVISGVGALLDYWGGSRKRAPVFFVKLRLEWLYRLTQNPLMLIERYTVGVFIFFKMVLLNRH